MLKLSVIIPVYNEKNTILKIVKEIEIVPVPKEIVIVDDGSNDGTREIIRKNFLGRKGFNVIFHEKNKGKGKAVQTGVQAASGDTVIIQDADLEYDPKDYSALVNALEEKNANVIYGSRFLKDRGATAFWHWFVNFLLTALTNICYGSRLTDMETCYKLFRANTIKKINIESRGFEIEVELTAKTLKNGEKIFEVPISYKGRSFHEGKKIGWKDGVKAVSAILRYRFGPP